LRDQTVPLAELWGADAADALAERLDAAPAADRVGLLERVVAERAHRDAGADPDLLVLAACRAAAAAAHAGRGVDVAGLADTLGVSERQLLRRFHAAVGYGPRTLARILRFRRFLAAVWERPDDAARPDLAWLAAETGYADQSHLARDCRRLAGVTPSQLVAGA
jgi:AraC-like DNA-binding protein